ncbi:hypothetical protein [Azoarcus sp. KH32C]|uniref:hypothetical protein n=1 Tax=Azoarcus sp. KH32C TaxID=748247 RepID=UPI0002385FD1|nr:hypothetical protein [Azoarcus sp. KH32C]BAL23500.1 hypothetical protein AZKH_1171 [Azoarcus sp. KH32C]
MAEKTYSHKYRRRAAGTRAETTGLLGWPPRELTAIWFGVPWMNFYFRFWNRWIEQLNRGSGTAHRDREMNDDRRHDAVPWMPQFEATVIPMRRSTDTPGSEAARLSMRVSMPSLPWAPGTGNVISIDTLLPRPTTDDVLEKPDDSPARQPLRGKP